MIPKKFSNSKN